jgi:hypothetical protein
MIKAQGADPSLYQSLKAHSVKCAGDRFEADRRDTSLTSDANRTLICILRRAVLELPSGPVAEPAMKPLKHRKCRAVVGLAMTEKNTVGGRPRRAAAANIKHRDGRCGCAWGRTFCALGRPGRSNVERQQTWPPRLCCSRLHAQPVDWHVWARWSTEGSSSAATHGAAGAATAYRDHACAVLPACPCARPG